MPEFDIRRNPLFIVLSMNMFFFRSHEATSKHAHGQPIQLSVPFSGNTFFLIIPDFDISIGYNFLPTKVAFFYH
jgi:hypothetical protein